MLLSASLSAQQAPLYSSDAFTVFPDKVVQGTNTAQVISPQHIRSNYRSPANATFSRLVVFKISINEKDNELPPGKDHWLIIGNEHESPVIQFGTLSAPAPAKPGTYLPTNYAYTFRVDMSPVIRQFEEKGYYEAYDGSRVARSDFKGFYIAGSADPLSWDFVGLDEKGLKLTDTGKDNIYTLTVQLNPWKEVAATDKEWKLQTDLSQRAHYQSDQPIVDALFNLSLEEAVKNIEPDSTFRTGAKWGGVWTRDVSYSTLLAFAWHEPEVAKTSLRKKVKRGRIIQDTGSGGAWPVSSDRMTWALAAWEIYKATGDRNWLKESYEIIKNSASDDAKTIFEPSLGLSCGESSFLDWREQTYPKWMSNMDIYVSQNLGTNVVHYQTHKILAQMALILGEPTEGFEATAEALKKGINEHLWMPDKGYYAQFLYGRPHLTTSPRFEALGEALAIWFGVADERKAKRIMSQSPVTPFGATCIYPQIPGIPPYHNNAVWPFVQAYWNLAAAKAGNEQALNHGLAGIYRAGALFLTNYENFVAESGDFLGTEINSDRMLWSMAGNLAMVHRVFMGMSFEPDGIRFQPVIPKTYPGVKQLSNFHYRQAVLNITVNGYGNRVRAIFLDGEPMGDAFFPASLSGTHDIRVEMQNNDFSVPSWHTTNQHFSLPTPLAHSEGNYLVWEAVPGAVHYNIYKNGTFFKKTTANKLQLTSLKDKLLEFKVSATDAKGFESFTSEPVVMVAPDAVRVIEAETFSAPSSLPFSNYSGKGFVELSTEQNRRFNVTIEVPHGGKYWINARYSNGSGHWNTDNMCAIRSLEVNGKYAGALIFPQRGLNEWSDWGMSNYREITLKKGKNIIALTFEDWNNNMNVDVNRAMLDCIRLIKS